MIIEHPLYISLGSLLFGNPRPYVFMDWRPEDGTRVTVVRLDGSEVRRAAAAGRAAPRTRPAPQPQPRAWGAALLVVALARALCQRAAPPQHANPRPTHLPSPTPPSPTGSSRRRPSSCSTTARASRSRRPGAAGSWWVPRRGGRGVASACVVVGRVCAAPRGPAAPRPRRGPCGRRSARHACPPPPDGGHARRPLACPRGLPVCRSARARPAPLRRGPLTAPAPVETRPNARHPPLSNAVKRGQTPPRPRWWTWRRTMTPPF